MNRPVIPYADDPGDSDDSDGQGCFSPLVRVDRWIELDLDHSNMDLCPSPPAPLPLNASPCGATLLPLPSDEVDPNVDPILSLPIPLFSYFETALPVISLGTAHV